MRKVPLQAAASDRLAGILKFATPVIQMQLKRRNCYESMSNQHLKCDAALSKALTTDVSLLRTSFRIVQKGTQTIIVEDIVKPVTIIIAEKLFGNKTMNHMKEIPSLEKYDRISSHARDSGHVLFCACLQ